MKITLEWLKQKGACTSYINCFLSQDETDGIKVLERLKEEKEFGYLIWLTPRLMSQAQGAEWAIYCAEQILPFFEQKFPNDKRPRRAIEAAREWLGGSSEKPLSVALEAIDAAKDAALRDEQVASHAAYAAAKSFFATTAPSVNSVATAAYTTVACGDDKIREAIMDKALEILTR